MGKPNLVRTPVYLSDEYIAGTERTGGSEPSQYPKEEKTTVIPLVVASERGIV